MEVEPEYATLLVASVIAFLIPYVATRLNIPVIVGEILLGIAVGFVTLFIEGLTGWRLLTFDPGSAVYFLSEIGLIFLLFLAGLEIDFNMMSERGVRTLLMAVLAFSATFLVALGITLAAGVRASFFLALVVSTTSLGVVLPVVREMGIVRTGFGQDIILAAIIADFGTMLMIPVVVAAQKHASLVLPLIIMPLVALLFVALYYLGGYMLWRWPRAMARFFRPDDPNETGVRASFLLIMTFVVLAAMLQTEVILGAFLAGAAISFLFRQSGDLEQKLFGFGFGFLIPLFFVRVGVGFAHSVTEPEGIAALWLVPLLIGVTWVVKVIPSLHQVPAYGLRRSVASGLLLSGGLSLAIVAAEIGRAEGILDASVSAAIIFFAIVMAVVSPMIFRTLVTGRGAEVEEGTFELVTIEGRPLEGGIDVTAEGAEAVMSASRPDEWAEVVD